VLVIHFAFSLYGNPRRTETTSNGANADLGVALCFTLSGTFPANRVHQAFAQHISGTDVTWIKPHRDHCVIDLDAARKALPYLRTAEWMRGTAIVEPDIVSRPHEGAIGLRPQTDIVLVLNREEVTLSQQSRIFLSHKSANKEMVKRFRDVLEELGFQPWLDEDDGRAGDNPHRLFLDGMKASCAAVFFITPEFRDERYLKQEIELALHYATERGDRFRIIALRMLGANGERGTVPDVLQTRYIFAEPDFELEALNAILRALPIHVGPVTWR
jgi:hypothetical protein